MKEKHYFYYLKAYIYTQIYIHNYEFFKKAEKMRILKKENNDLLFNPEGLTLLQRSSKSMYKAKSERGPHFYIFPQNFKENSKLKKPVNF